MTNKNEYLSYKNRFSRVVYYSSHPFSPSPVETRLAPQTLGSIFGDLMVSLPPRYI